MPWALVIRAQQRPQSHTRSKDSARERLLFDSRTFDANLLALADYNASCTPDLCSAGDLWCVPVQRELVATGTLVQ